MDFSNDFKETYYKFLEKYGAQGWWPVRRFYRNSENNQDISKPSGYHPNNYNVPETESGILEVMIGAILTQNVAWIRAENALRNLFQDGDCSIPYLNNMDNEVLSSKIKTSGYYNQKSKRIKNLLKFLKNTSIFELKNMGIKQIREKLLNVKGIGKETADSIILYGFKKPIFVIDSYTKRLFSRLGYFSKEVEYDAIQLTFESNLGKNYKVFNEYHALIVRHSVEICKSKPLCKLCILKKGCKQNRGGEKMRPKFC